jgi:hypothetical protein
VGFLSRNCCNSHCDYYCIKSEEVKSSTADIMRYSMDRIITGMVIKG